MSSLSFRTLLASSAALALLSLASPAGAQSPADAKRTLKAWQLFYKEPGMIEVDPRYMRGTLMLTGFVPTEDHMKKADELANSLKGVKEIRNRLKVRAPDVAAPSDAEIKTKLDKYIDEQEDLSKQKAKGNITLDIAQGGVTVKGKLDDYSEANQLLNEIRKTPGVKTVVFDDLSY